MKKYSIIFILLILTACSEKAQPGRSMEQIYQDEGVPVQTAAVNRSEFSTTKTYLGVLRGIDETSVHSAIGEKVEEVHVKVGDEVKKDDLLVSFPKDSPAAGYPQAKAAYQNAKSTLDRLKTLYDAGGISRQDLDNAKTGYDVSKANFEAVTKMIAALAPISGTVVKVSVRETDNVDREMHLVTIARLDRIKTHFGIPEHDRSEVKIGQKVFINQYDQTFEGTITQVDMALDYATRTFGIMAEFDNRNNLLIPGSTAEIHVETYSSKNTIAIDRKNILGTSDAQYVFVANDDVCKKIDIQTGMSQDGRVEIISGLNIGMSLITSGLHLLDDGLKIQLVK